METELEDAQLAPGVAGSRGWRRSRMTPLVAYRAFTSFHAAGRFRPMRVLLAILAVLGIVAVVSRLAGALLRALGRTAEHVAAGHAVDTRARRGDLTGLAEAGAWQTEARRRRRQAWLVGGLWAGLLVAPLYTPLTSYVYAAYALLWAVEAGVRRLR